MIASKQGEAPLVASVLRGLEHVVMHHLPNVYPNYIEVLSCLGSLSCNFVETVSVRCIELLYMCARPISDSSVSPDMWVVLYSGIASRILDSRYELQTKALSVLFQLFREYGDLYQREQWKMIYSGVILPIFDDMSSGGDLDREWLNNTCVEALHSFVDLISERFEALNFLLHDFLLLLGKVVCTLEESVAKVAVSTLGYLGKAISARFNEGMWGWYLGVVGAGLDDSLPVELENDQGELNFDVPKTIGKCVIQLHLISALQELVKRGTSVPAGPMCAFLPRLVSSYEFARKFDQDIEKRYKMWRNGFVSHSQRLPGLFKQEKLALTCLLEIYFELNRRAAGVTESLFTLCREILSEVVHRNEFAEERQKEVDSLLPVVSDVILQGGLEDLPETMKQIGPELVGLVVIEDRAVREQLKLLLLRSLSLMSI